MYKIEIDDLKSSIAQCRKNIKATRDNMARTRANKGPKHYLESGKRSIEHQKKLIEGYNQKIANYKEKKKSMEKGVDSFKREVGKNTGKWVSNKIFGDGHATPHKVNVNTTNKSIADTNKETLWNKGKELLKDSTDEIFGDNQEIKNYNTKKDEVIATPIPKDADEIMNLVNLMLSNIKSNGWKSGNNEDHINALSDACLAKLEQCVIRLKSINELHQATYVENEIQKLKKKKRFQKYGIWVAIVFLFLIGFILYKLGIVK